MTDPQPKERTVTHESIPTLDDPTGAGAPVLPADRADGAWDPPQPPAARPGGRRMRRVTGVLAAAVLLVAGFVAGIQVEKRSGVTPAPTTAAGGAATGGAAGIPRGGALGGRGGAVVGTIKGIDGSTLYVTEASGNTVAVRTVGSTITITSTGTLTKVHPGQTVLVRGTTAKNGSVSARSVAVGITGLFGGGGLGGGGFPGGGAPGGG
ncbi:MAG TPA: hypothetical protein VNN74_09440 [Candidatus Micrarchaeia archaeon]|nr:hypothetical protein [Candidatus Micrarchaeia archaeon]